MSHDELPVPLGSTLAGKYSLERILGKGGMGAVYEARNLGTNRRVAVKVMRTEITRSKDFEGRFLREARATGTIEHPNVVTVFDVGQDPETGCLYLVMEFMLGQDLQHRMAYGAPLQLQEISEVLVPVMSALATAHASGIVHRDIKPANIYLVRTGDSFVPKVIDFGIAKLHERVDSGPVTRTGIAMGTPAYMSPEQAQESKDVDAQTDVWSLGIVAFELLAGRYPFQGDNFTDLLVNVMTSAPLRADFVRDTVPSDVADVVMQANTRDRQVRFKTMPEFLDAWLGCASVASTEWGRALVRRYGSPTVARDSLTNPLLQTSSTTPTAPPTHVPAAPKIVPSYSTLVGSAANIRVPLHPRRGRTIGFIAAGIGCLGLVLLVLHLGSKDETRVVKSAGSVSQAVDAAPPAAPAQPRATLPAARAVLDASLPAQPVARVEADAGAVEPVAQSPTAVPDAGTATHVAAEVEPAPSPRANTQAPARHVPSTRVPRPRERPQGHSSAAPCIPDPENGVYCN